jgi:peptidoglycan/xylan/chitin deacetylase (PgdA/CDA1 family)
VTFTPDAYEELLTDLLEREYRATAFPQFEGATGELLLRHDVDFSPKSAAKLAEIEAELGVQATYFFLLRSPFYNPSAPRSLRQLEQILDLGHEVGLHFDASLYQTEDDSLHDAARRECERLEELIRRSVDTISLHRPSGTLQGTPEDLAGRPHTYQPRFFRDIEYCSESRGAWYHGHPLDRPAVEERRPFHLLVHPIWWDGPEAQSPQERLDNFLAARTEGLSRAIEAHCTAYEGTPSDGKTPT